MLSVLILLLSILMVFSTFSGKYSDPNHPSCAREIRIESVSKADIYGADAAGGEGASCDGETDVKWGPVPASYLGNRINADFSSKGGPSDLSGKYVSSDLISQIQWEDGNAWTKLSE